MNKEKIKETIRVAAKTWIPLEEKHKENIVEGTKTKLPKRLILAIILITVSLLLIVMSAVVLDTARNKRNALEGSIEDLDAEIAQLETDLNKKNEGIDIEIFAEEVLGMINQEHANSEYIDSNKTDGVEKEEESAPNLASLIKWFFQFLK